MALATAAADVGPYLQQYRGTGGGATRRGHKRSSCTKCSVTIFHILAAYFARFHVLPSVCPAPAPG